MIRVQFWGTRGSITTPGRAMRHYGGNTPCVQLVGFENDEPGAVMRPDNPQIILDGGTGLTSLQTTLMHRAWGQGQGELHLLLSHYHWDHLIGLPFFKPIFVQGNRIIFYGASIKNTQDSIERLFTSVYSPLNGIQNVSAQLEYRQVESKMEVAGFQIQTAQNSHPGGALSFRIEYGPATIVYSTDHEVGDQTVDSNLVKFAKGAQLWILDAHFNAEEEQIRRGWGHSSHLEAVQLALEAQVETAVLFHHNPEHDDTMLDKMASEAIDAAAGSQTKVIMARDGLTVDVA